MKRIINKIKRLLGIKPKTTSWQIVSVKTEIVDSIEK